MSHTYPTQGKLKMKTPTLKIDIVGENIPDEEVQALSKAILAVIKTSKIAFDVVSADGVVLSYVHKNQADVSDGYHSFNELYKHRHALFIALLSKTADRNEDAWFSKLHRDGTFYPGWVIAGCYVNVPIKSEFDDNVEFDRMQIRYHLPDSYIPHLKAAGCVELDRAVEWDGSNSDDTIDRLLMAHGCYDAVIAEKKQIAHQRISTVTSPLNVIQED